MSNFEYFTITIGLSSDSDGELDRREALKAFKDDAMQMVILDDTGATWVVHSLHEISE